MQDGIPYTIENLGKKDPEYGGILTDISTLPEGTEFYVCNGAWNGRIVCLDDGRLGVQADDPARHEPSPFFPAGSPDNILAISGIKLPDNGRKDT